MKREIKEQDVIQLVKNACIKANCDINDDVANALKSALENEESQLAKDIIVSNESWKYHFKEKVIVDLFNNFNEQESCLTYIRFCLHQIDLVFKEIIK